MKKFSFGSIIIRFIILPILFLVCAFYIFVMVTTLFMAPDASAVVADLFCCAMAAITILSIINLEIAMAKKSTQILSASLFFGAFYCAYSLATSISAMYYNLEFSILSLLIDLAIALVISIWVHSHCKKHLWRYENHCENIFFGIVFSVSMFLFYGALATVEIITLYEMFSISIGYGAFGLFVPVVSQIVHMFNTGFDSSFSLVIYEFLVMAIAYIIAGVSVTRTMDD